MFWGPLSNIGVIQELVQGLMSTQNIPTDLSQQAMPRGGAELGWSLEGFRRPAPIVWACRGQSSASGTAWEGRVIWSGL